MNAVVSEVEYVPAPEGASIPASVVTGPVYATERRALSSGHSIRVVRSCPPRREVEPPRRVNTPARDAALVYAETRLRAWAHWAKDNRGSVGYPTISALYRAMLTTKVGIIRGGSLPDPKVSNKTGVVEVQYANGAEGVETRSMRSAGIGEVPEAIIEVDRAVAKIPAKPRQVLIADYFTHGPIEERCRKTPYKRARYLQLLETAKYAVYVALMTGSNID